MSGFIGALGSLGMFFLIAALFCAFLREVGVVHKETLQSLLRTALGVIATGGIYWILGGLIYAATYGPEAAVITDLPTIFRTPYLEWMYSALENPSFSGLFSGLFAYAGHFLGKILFQQYLLGGMLLSLSLTMAGFSLIASRLARLYGIACAKDASFLLLAMPGAVFLFLPGWLSIVFFLIALAFYLAGKKIPPRAFAYSQAGFGLLLSLLSICSAAVLYALVTGKWM